ncbi:MAG TPA: peptidylprolyl isomerase [Candidatus Methylomirabilis sp.]|nr:peptidylprolyl isomerase [Candidatus Methylomirabilis sp.]
MSAGRLFFAVVLLLSTPVSVVAQATQPAAPSAPATSPSAPSAPVTSPPAPSAPAPSATAPPAPSNAAIENGSVVKLEYTLKDDAGVVLDSNKGQDPLTFTQGSQQLMPGLEKQMIGLHAGDEKKVVLKPEEAFGQTDPNAQAEVAKNMLPPEALKVGARLMARNASGEQRPVTVKEIKSETVVLDLNHPLAGKTLVFELKVLDVAPPKPDAPAAESPKAAEPPKAGEAPKTTEPGKPSEPKSN